MNANPMRAIDPTDLDYRCPDCHDSGYVSDQGPGTGRDGATEYMPCDCDPRQRAIRCIGRKNAKQS